MTVHVDRRPGGLRDRVDHGGDVLELARQLVAGGVAAGAAAPPVEGMDGGVRLQVGQQRAPAPVVGHGAVHQHQRRPSPLVHQPIAVPSRDTVRVMVVSAVPVMCRSSRRVELRLARRPRGRIGRATYPSAPRRRCSIANRAAAARLDTPILV